MPRAEPGLVANAESREWTATIADEESAVGYVRCGLPQNWGQIREKNYLADPPMPASTRSLNPLHRRQRKLILRFISRTGFRLWRIFSDVEQQGKLDLCDRVGLGKMMFHLRQRGIRRVVVDRADHLSSDPVERLVLLQDFQSMGVRVFEASHSRELTSDLYINRQVSRSSDDEVNATRKALGRLKWRGSLLGAKNRVGRKAFGASPEERTVLTRILELSRALPKDQRTKGSIRRSFRQIADMLNEEQLPSRTGKPWTSSTVQGIIKRERPDLAKNWSGRLKK